MKVASESRERGFEVADASVRAVCLAVVIIAAGTIASMVVVRLMMRGAENAPSAFGVADHVGSFTYGAEEETSIQKSWDQLNGELRRTMSGYGWIDREHGIVRIPIERAMELVAQENGGGEQPR